MSKMSVSSVKVKSRSSLQGGIMGHLYNESTDLDIGRKLEGVPLDIRVMRQHLSGCSSFDLRTNVAGTKNCIDCASYPLRDTTNKCETKYVLSVVDSKLNLLEVELSQENLHTGEALYRVMNSIWTNPGEVLIVLESKKGIFSVSRSPRTPSKLQRDKAIALSTKKEECL